MMTDRHVLIITIAMGLVLAGCFPMPKRVDSLEALGIEKPATAANGSINDLKGKPVAIVLSPNTKAMVDYDKTVKEKSTPLNDYATGGADARSAMFDSRSYVVVLAEMLKSNFPQAALAGSLDAADHVNPAAIVLVDVFREVHTIGSFAPTATVTTWRGRFDFLTSGSPRSVHRTLEAVVTEKCPPPNWGSTTFAQCDAKTRDRMLGELRQQLDFAMR